MPRILLIAWVAALLGACSPSSSPPSSASAGPAPIAAASPVALADPAAPRVLEQLQAGGANASYALVAGSCEANRCPLHLELRRPNETTDRVTLEFAASDASWSREAGVRGSPPVWKAGSEEGEVRVSLQAVRWMADPAAPQGVLVTQSGGFEHVKRNHALYSADGMRLRTWWSREDGAGPAWSEARIVRNTGSVAEDIVFIEGFQPGGSEPDTVSAQRLSFDAATRSVRSTPITSLPVVVAGDFASVDAARQAMTNSACLAGYGVLPAEKVGGQRRRFVLASVTADEAQARQEIDRNCDAAVRRAIGTLKTTRSKG